MNLWGQQGSVKCPSESPPWALSSYSQSGRTIYGALAREELSSGLQAVTIIHMGLLPERAGRELLYRVCEGRPSSPLKALFPAGPPYSCIITSLQPLAEDTVYFDTFGKPRLLFRELPLKIVGNSFSLNSIAFFPCWSMCTHFKPLFLVQGVSLAA